MNRVLGEVDGDLLHVMTMNVRRPLPRALTRRADRWDRRRAALLVTLSRESPSALGLQEVLPGTARDIAGALGTAYARIGVGRGPRGNGEGCPIFFDHSRLELVEQHQFALSDSPEVAGSRSWGNPMPRAMVVGVFRDRRTRASFAMINTHLDPFSARSRVRAAEQIRQEVRRRGLPAVVVGDMNAAAGSPALEALTRGELLTDAWGTADERVTPLWGTYTGYRAPVRGGARIDWILTTPDIAVDRVGIDARPVDGVAGSDHLPVHAAIEVPR
ncbi:endonuclease/exonuclease/phosphatase family protein [Microbacterium sp. NPDC091382]|uniref:endonuclease/exonuclease/phosphatase family protein n=1 Tax=Microbacterium sp. NPDC091382 TaxID=3364210 RepID=UPI003824DDC4